MKGKPYWKRFPSTSNDFECQYLRGFRDVFWKYTITIGINESPVGALAELRRKRLQEAHGEYAKGFAGVHFLCGQSVWLRTYFGPHQRRNPSLNRHATLCASGANKPVPEMSQSMTSCSRLARWQPRNVGASKYGNNMAYFRNNGLTSIGFPTAKATLLWSDSVPTIGHEHLMGLVHESRWYQSFFGRKCIHIMFGQWRAASFLGTWKGITAAWYLMVTLLPETLMFGCNCQDKSLCQACVHISKSCWMMQKGISNHDGY